MPHSRVCNIAADLAVVWLCSLGTFRGGHVGVRAAQAGQRLACDARVRATLLAIGRGAGAAFAACIDASLRCCEQERQHENHHRVLTSREASAECRRMLCCVKRRIGAARKRTAVYDFGGQSTVSWSGCWRDTIPARCSAARGSSSGCSGRFANA
jgi:hypothetical protein